MIQDIYPHKLYNEYNPAAKVQENSPVLNIYNGKVLVHTEKFDNHIIAFPLKKEMPEELEYTYLFTMKQNLQNSQKSANYPYLVQKG